MVHFNSVLTGRNDRPQSDRHPEIAQVDATAEGDAVIHHHDFLLMTCAGGVLMVEAQVDTSA